MMRLRGAVIGTILGLIGLVVVVQLAEVIQTEVTLWGAIWLAVPVAILPGIVGALEERKSSGHRPGVTAAMGSAVQSYLFGLAVFAGAHLVLVIVGFSAVPIPALGGVARACLLAVEPIPSLAAFIAIVGVPTALVVGLIIQQLERRRHADDAAV